MRTILTRISILFAVFCFVGCGEKPVYSEVHEISGAWKYDQPLSFTFDISDVSQYYDLILGLTIGQEYGYQNIYVKIVTEYPDNTKNEDIVSLNVTDGSGSYLGSCNSKECVLDILLQEKFKFKSAGKHVISIFQNGRNPNLEEVRQLELKLYELEVGTK